MSWKAFAVGLLCGLVLAFIVFQMVGERYRVVAHGPSGMIIIRLDTWTGQSWMWRYYDKDGSRIWYWEPMETRAR